MKKAKLWWQALDMAVAKAGHGANIVDVCCVADELLEEYEERFGEGAKVEERKKAVLLSSDEDVDYVRELVLDMVMLQIPEATHEGIRNHLCGVPVACISAFFRSKLA